LIFSNIARHSAIPPPIFRHLARSWPRPSSNLLIFAPLP
jgi:hypothetical protein